MNLEHSCKLLGRRYTDGDGDVHLGHEAQYLAPLTCLPVFAFGWILFCRRLAQR